MPKPQYITASDGTQLDAGIVNLSKAIRQTESRGNYNAKGASGEFGAYQWMPETWVKHAQLAGVDPNDRSPVAQDKVAYKVIESRKNAGLTPEQITSEWNSGKPDAYRTNHRGYNKQGVYYDTPAYTKKVIDAFQQLKGGQTPQYATTTSTVGVQNPDSLRSDLEARKQQFIKGQEQVQSGEIGVERGLLRAAGAGAGAIGDIGSRALSAVIPDAIEKPAMEHIAGKVQKAVESPLGQVAVSKAQQLSQKYPQVAQDIKDIGNIAGVVPFGAGGGFAAKTALKSTEGLVARAAEKQVAGLAEDYAELFGTRSPLRGRVMRAEEKGRDLPTFLAEKAQGPDGAKLEVDTNGNVDASKLSAKVESDLQGLYKLRSELLKQYPETGDVEAFRQMALKAADSAENKAKGIVGDLQKEINTVMDSLKSSFGERVPLEVLQDIKIQQRLESKAFNALKPKRDRFSNANYLVSDSARKYIEEITKNPLVRELNDVIGMNLDADDLLQKISTGGAKVKGGRLGKYSLGGLGALIGVSAESALGPLVGGVLGNQLAGLLLKNQLSGPMRNFLLKKLQNEAPDIYKKVEDFIGAETLRRSQMLQLPAAGQSSFKEPTIFGREQGPGSASLQEAVDAQGVKGLVKPKKK